MTRMRKILTYIAQVLPDEQCSRNEELTNGSVRQAIFRIWEHLLRTIANLPSRSVCISLIAAFTPHYERGHRQSRLRLYLKVVAQDGHIAQAVDTLICGSLLHRLYRLKRIAAIPSTAGLLATRCHILRPEDFIKPLHSDEFNPHIPESYYSITSFSADEDNSNLEYDRTLDNIDEEVRIEIQVQPESVLDELAVGTAYLSRLESINRDSGFQDDDYRVTDAGAGVFSDRSDRIRPLHRRDPLADDLARAHRRFHETLRQPHLLFSIYAAAETEATARLIASVVAESAFEDGSYRLVVCETDDKKVASLPMSGSQGMVKLLPIPAKYWPAAVRDTYVGFARLSQLACVDELLGVFRFPVASFASPCCIRKDTDPPDEDPLKMIVLGHDQQLYDPSRQTPGPVRGLAFDQLNKHWLVAGKTRSGKTTAVMNAVLQLSGLLSPDEIEEK